jgi:formylglycine-generating enzyme required for sulfatase activity
MNDINHIGRCGGSPHGPTVSGDFNLGLSRRVRHDRRWHRREAQSLHLLFEEGFCRVRRRTAGWTRSWGLRAQCTWEVDRTLKLSKRLLPVIFKSAPDHDIPEKLRRLQFVCFDSGTGFARPLSQLAEALRQDLDWIREHTRLGEIATRWERRGHLESLLLRGDDIDSAKTWMAARNAGAPEITDTQRAFVKASEEAESTRLDKEREQLKETVRQQRRIAWLLGGVAVLMGGSILGLIAWINQSYLEQLLNLYTREGPYKKAEFQPHILSAERERALKPKETFRECEKDCPEMVLIPAGSFMMGSPESETGRLAHEGPQHEVTIAKPFAVSKFEVMWDEWDPCAKYHGCPQDIPDSAWGHGKRPVINVTWEQVQQYVRWLSKMTGKSYRLLTEAEWEYAARADIAGGDRSRVATGGPGNCLAS